MADLFYFSSDTQDLLLACMCRWGREFSIVGPLVKPEYMWGTSATKLCSFIQNFNKENSHYPTFQELADYTYLAYGPDKTDLYEACLDYINKLKKVNTRSWKWARTVTLDFCRERAVIAAIQVAADCVKNGKTPEGGFARMFDEAIRVGTDIENIGLSFTDDAEEIIKKLTDSTWGVKTGFAKLDEVWHNGWGPGWLVVPLAPPKSYKCLGTGTGIRMHNGLAKTVETIQVDDLVMGDDGTARRVLTAGHGIGPMFSVKQRQGTNFTCTADHILCVKHANGRVLEISASNYADKSHYFQRAWQGYKADGSRYPIVVTPIGIDDYFGFTVDGNHRFLLADATVTHNSTFSTNLALNMVRAGPGREPVPVFYYACEISAELTCARGYSVVADLGFDSMYKTTSKFVSAVRKNLNARFLDSEKKAGQLLLKGFPAKTASIADIRLHAKSAIDATGVTPKVIFIDHAETVKPAARTGKDPSDWRQQADIYTDARALGQELNCVVVMPDRCNKDTVQQPVPSMTSFQGSFEKAGVVDVAIGLCQTPEERLKNYIRYFVFVNRHGKQFDYFYGSVKENRFEMSIDDKLDYAEAQARARADQKEGRQRFSRPLPQIPRNLKDEEIDEP